MKWLGAVAWVLWCGVALAQFGTFPAMQSDLDFAYNGEDTCSGNVCRGGVCSGTAPNGTCTLGLNSQVSATIDNPDNDTDIQDSVIQAYRNFTLTGNGTLTIPAVNANLPFGRSLMIFVRGDFTMSGTPTIDVSGKGGYGVQGGTAVTCNSAGLVGGSHTYIGAISGGAAGAGPNPGQAGINSISLTQGSFFPGPTFRLFTFRRFFWLAGTGGGSNASSGAIAAPVMPSVLIPAFGATGGSGGGCDSGCSGNIGTGGQGGGMFWAEVGGSLNISGGTIDAHGLNGTNGAAGGGGGGIVILYRNLTQNTSMTTNVNAGAAFGVPPTNCGSGGSGGVGQVYIKSINS